MSPTQRGFPRSHEATRPHKSTLFGRPARGAPSLPFFLGASDVKGRRGGLGLPAWQTQGPGSAEVAPLPELLSRLEVPTLDDLLLFICCNLSSDRASSPLIIPVMPLRNAVQWICFSKNHSARDYAREKGNPLLAEAGD